MAKYQTNKTKRMQHGNDVCCHAIRSSSVKYIQIEELPRTLNGKLDYKKLQQY